MLDSRCKPWPRFKCCIWWRWPRHIRPCVMAGTMKFMWPQEDSTSFQRAMVGRKHCISEVVAWSPNVLHIWAAKLVRKIKRRDVHKGLDPVLVPVPFGRQQDVLHHSSSIDSKDLTTPIAVYHTHKSVAVIHLHVSRPPPYQISSQGVRRRQLRRLFRHSHLASIPTRRPRTDRHWYSNCRRKWILVGQT